MEMLGNTPSLSLVFGGFVCCWVFRRLTKGARWGIVAFKMTKSIICALFWLVGFGYSLELISGTVVLPRFWWLNNDPKPACIYCEEINKFIIHPNAYEEWEKQAAAKWNTCMADLAARGVVVAGDSRRQCDEAANADWRSVGSKLKTLKGNVYRKTEIRFRMAIAAHNKKALWSLILGAALHLLSAVFVLVPLANIGDEIQKIIIPAKKKDARLPAPEARFPCLILVILGIMLMMLFLYFYLRITG